MNSATYISRKKGFFNNEKTQRQEKFRQALPQVSFGLPPFCHLSGKRLRSDLCVPREAHLPDCLFGEVLPECQPLIHGVAFLLPGNAGVRVQGRSSPLATLKQTIAVLLPVQQLYRTGNNVSLERKNKLSPLFSSTVRESRLISVNCASMRAFQ